MHRACQRHAGELLPEPRRNARGRRDHDDRRGRTARGAASRAIGFRRARCLSMRLLHVRPDHVCGRAARGALRADRRRCARMHERQHLSLRRLSQHRRGDPGSPRQVIAMRSFEFRRAQDALAAIAAAAAAKSGTRFVAGGTTLLDLMKLNVERPEQLIDINRLPLDQVEPLADGGLKIGATVRNAALANHPIVQRDYAVLSQALLAGASGQLRNMATTGGNLLQRTRCMYFRDTAMPCNKRQPGTGCSAIGGANRTLAILGTSEHCIASNPSDMNVAMAALEATIHVRGIKGERSIPIAEFHLLPGNTPNRETVLEPGDLITHVTLPAPVRGDRCVYLKLRDRASYEFALASAAVVVTVKAGRVARARIALGGVGTKPWRSTEAEDLLVGQPVGEPAFRRAADAALRDARPQSQNGFKVELARRCLVHALKEATQ